MPDMASAPQSELPSSRTLLRSTAIAAGVAALLLVLVVLPAEYGVDPTGVGRLLGLTKMGEIKVALAKEAADATAAEAAAAAGRTDSTAVSRTAAAPAAPPPAGSTSSVTAAAQVGGAKPDSNAHVTRVTLAPGKGKEVKLVMRKDARVNYSWSTDRGVVNYDTHADREAAPAIKYHGYAKGQGKASDEGVLVAAFDGMHGWFWRNRTNEIVTVTLRTSGDYHALKEMP